MAVKIATTTQERIGRVEQCRQLGVPRDIQKDLKLEAGGFVDNALTITEAKKIRHALEQIREGRTKPWPQIKHDLGL